jgi:anaerobic magnesium-protoporphyrin IX monomethyl ester cyclase
MKILFVYPNITKEEGISSGVAYLSGHLKQHGCETDLMDFTWTNNINSCIKKIRQSKPDIIGFTLTTMDFDFCVKVANEVKNNFDIPIVFGGVHPTMAPEETINKKSIDIVCVGEGELALTELLDRMEKSEPVEHIKNFWFKKEGKIIRNPVRPLIENLDVLSCDRELFDYKKYLKARGYIVDIYAGRGCPYKCAYCINHALQKLYDGKGRYVRLRSIENIIQEIQELQKKYNVKAIAFPDDTFTYNKRWLKEFCTEYAKSIKLPFSCNGRVENIDSELCKTLKDAGCNSIMFGVESGSEKIRREILSRPISDEKIISAFRNTKNSGIKTFSYNMVGIPYETAEDVKKTIELNKKIEPDEVQCTIFYPFPGTDLLYLCEENGWITKGRTKDYSLESIMKYEHITPNEIKKQRDFFAFNVFKAYNKSKAVRSLLIGKYYHIYLQVRGKMPLLLRQMIQRCANTFYYG